MVKLLKPKDWLPEGATNYRETEIACMWDEIVKHSGRVRKVRRAKYLVVGGPLAGAKICTQQMWSEPYKYHEYNQSSGGKYNSPMKMIYVHHSLLENDIGFS